MENYYQKPMYKWDINMFCFCRNELYKMRIFESIKFENGRNYCDNFFSDFRIIQILNSLPSFIIVSINLVTQFLFVKMSKLECQKTKSFENDSLFIMVLLSNLICIGIVHVYTET